MPRKASEESGTIRLAAIGKLAQLRSGLRRDAARFINNDHGPMTRPRQKKETMSVLLHRPGQASELAEHYQRAFAEATELYVVSAYLTEWNTSLKVNPACSRFRLIVGKDFGITRKDACRAALKWLPAQRKGDFMVAERLSGFHPKAVIWATAQQKHFMLVGSSNLSAAAFDGNVEANAFAQVSAATFEQTRQWIDWIEEHCVPMSEDWLEHYVEASRESKGAGGRKKASTTLAATVELRPPRPNGIPGLLKARRKQLQAYDAKRDAITRLFRKCAKGQVDNADFYARIGELWGFDAGNRLQGTGWERQGKDANFRELAEAFVAIIDASKRQRDDVVREELDKLNEAGNPARQAFFSEMLCLRFPQEYPVLNDPVQGFLSEIRFAAPRGASAGTKYIDLARKLRAALRANPKYPAKSLAELDTLLWAHAKQKKERAARK